MDEIIDAIIQNTDPEDPWRMSKKLQQEIAKGVDPRDLIRGVCRRIPMVSEKIDKRKCYQAQRKTIEELRNLDKLLLLLENEVIPVAL